MASGPHASAGRRTGRVLVALASAVVLVATGIGWDLFSDLTGGISTSDVIAGRLGGLIKPAGTDQNILLVGVDSRTDAKGRPLSKKVLAELRSGAEQGVLNSDTIILIHVPADGSKATGFSIPRDSYVDIPGEGKNKINSVYPTKKFEAATDLREKGEDPDTVELESSTAGRQALIKTVERLTGVTVDHYAEVNLLGFYNLTNAIGGVEVCLKNPVNEYRSGARFPAGKQTISGGAALAFVRQRYDLPHSDFDRMRRQQVFLAGVARKILSAGTLTNPARLQDLIDVAKESVVLDTGWDVLGFARQASDLAGGKIQFVTIPVEGGTSNEHGDVVLVDPEVVQTFVAERIGEPGPAAAPPPAADAVSPADLIVEVSNATGRTGLAGKVARKMATLGYIQGKVSNATPQSDSVVHFAPGESAAGDQVAKTMGGVTTQEDAQVTPGRVRIVLGSHFSISDISDDDSSSAASPSSSSSSRPGAKASAVPPPPPITAEGVPCVD